jgi:hypothetical protein
MIRMPGMHKPSALIAAGALSLIGLGLAREAAPQKAAAVPMVVYKSPT